MSYVFVYGERMCSNFIDLHAYVQLSQHPLLNRLFFALYILASFVKDELSIGLWVYITFLVRFIPQYFILGRVRFLQGTFLKISFLVSLAPGILI